MTQTKSWFNLVDRTGLCKEDWVSHCFFAASLEREKKSNLIFFTKTFEDIDGFNKLLSELVQFLKKELKELENNFSYKEKHKELNGNFIELCSDDSYAVLDLTSKRIKKISFSLRSFDDNLMQEVKKIFDKFESKFEVDESIDQDSEIFVMTSGQQGIEFTNTGKAENSLVRPNYSGEVNEEFDYIRDQLQEKKPDGRLVILHGVPGSGKTYLVEGLMDAVKNSVFVLIPSEYLSSLNNPSFLPALIGLKEEIGFENDIGVNGEDDVYDISFGEEDEWNEVLTNARTDKPSPGLARKHGSLILVVEDADANLAKREGHNQNIISSVLNFADGILGRTLDLRIVCTTNLEDMVLDEAITRPGRLLKKVHVGKLNPQEAELCYRSILLLDENEETPKEALAYLKNGGTVAEIYKLAQNKRDAEKVLKKKDVTKKFGF
jgi:ATP-dependent 26S proteasome regulatory subunit